MYNCSYVILFLYVLLLVCLLHASKLTLDLVAFGEFYYEVFGPEKMGKKRNFIISSTLCVFIT